MGNRNKDIDGLGERAFALAKDAGSALSDSVIEQANELGSKGMDVMGDGLDTATDKLASKAHSISGRGNKRTAKTVDGIAGRLHDAADYLHEEDPKSVIAAVEQAMIAHPYRTLLAGIAVGYLITKKR